MFLGKLSVARVDGVIKTKIDELIHLNTHLSPKLAIGISVEYLARGDKNS